jgi:hypothetical protein
MRSLFVHASAPTSTRQPRSLMVARATLLLLESLYPKVGYGAAGLLRRPYPEPHARRVRHANDEDLDRLEELLVKLRALPQLRERKRGSLSRGSRAFLHFHEDAGDLYVDVRLHDAFLRMRVTSLDEQADFLAQVRRTVQ